MRHVLIVESDAGVRDVVQTYLRRDGYWVSAAGNAEDAVAMLRPPPPDAAVIDAALARGSGLRVAHRAAELGVPAMVLTEAPSVQRVLAASGCRYLEKPFRLEKLGDEVRALMERTQPAWLHHLEASRAAHLAALERLAVLQEDLARLKAECGGHAAATAVPRPRVLVVDPDPRQRASMRRILGELGLDVVEAGTAAEAREQCRAARIAVAVMEVNLPRTPGDVVAAEMAEAGVVPVLMSGSDYGLARARRAGLPALRKPCSLRDLFRAVILALPL